MFEIQFEPQTTDASASTRERVLVANVSEERQYVSGYTVSYSSGYEYAISGGLTLDPRATLAVVSHGEGDSVAETDPPTYYRNADLPELVLEDGEETVRLLDTDDDPVATAAYTEG